MVSQAVIGRRALASGATEVGHRLVVVPVLSVQDDPEEEGLCFFDALEDGDASGQVVLPDSFSGQASMSERRG